jgi:hypothetical protein
VIIPDGAGCFLAAGRHNVIGRSFGRRIGRQLIAHDAVRVNSPVGVAVWFA